MGAKATEARALAYRLFEIATQKGWASEALVYNELAQEWPQLEDAGARVVRAEAPAQAALDLSGRPDGGRQATSKARKRVRDALDFT